jgi:hypothetical protein
MERADCRQIFEIDAYDERFLSSSAGHLRC